MIRILLAEDQQMIRGALARLLDLETDLTVVAEASSGDEVVALALETRPDVALLDIQMPRLDGLAAAAALRRVMPGCPVLILTTFTRPGYVRRALEAGAAGFLAKDGPVVELADAVRRVVAGERVMDPALAVTALAAGPNPLSPREREVLATATYASSVADISRILYLSEGTVRNYLSAAIGKTGARNRTEAARIADANGWL
ncbi:MAG TPA: response regulator transcription factor [Cellulomonadaceae bacterium]|nr:response regulator transcription factor [Cellulomonadaceae bacterium]